MSSVRPRRRAGRRESGAALLILTIAFLLTLSAYLLTALAPNRARLERDLATERALAEAKEALIAYAVTSYENPGVTAQWRFGVLPCPDTAAAVPPAFPAEGEQEGPCGDQHRTSIGRLPWRTLGIAPLRDGANECLWYAVSGSHKQRPEPAMRNTDTRGLLEVRGPDGVAPLAGATPAERAVAVVIAPGPALTGQDRSDAPGGGVEVCGGNYDAANYLDCLDLDDGELCDAVTVNAIDNALPAPVADVVSLLAAGVPGPGVGGASEHVNDRIAVVTRADLERALLRRTDFARRLYDGQGSLLYWAARCLARYRLSHFQGTLPWAAPVALADYRVDGAYDDEPGRKVGRLPDIADHSPGPGWVMTDCAPPEVLRLWSHWKDHLFYAVAEGFRPGGPAACGPGTCLRVNGAGEYAAVVLFAREPLLGQSRDAPPTDLDEKSSVANYLESANLANLMLPLPTGGEDYDSLGPAPFNDVLIAITSAFPAAAAVVCFDEAGGAGPCL